MTTKTKKAPVRRKKEVVVSCDLNEKVWLNNAELALYLGIGSRNTFGTWRDEKGLPHYRIGSKDFLYKRTEIDAWVAQMKCQGLQ